VSAALLRPEELGREDPVLRHQLAAEGMDTLLKEEEHTLLPVAAVAETIHHHVVERSEIENSASDPLRMPAAETDVGEEVEMITAEVAADTMMKRQGAMGEGIIMMIHHREADILMTIAVGMFLHREVAVEMAVHHLGIATTLIIVAHGEAVVVGGTRGAFDTPNPGSLKGTSQQKAQGWHISRRWKCKEVEAEAEILRDGETAPPVGGQEKGQGSLT